jgi:hypothetical protein
MTHLLFAELLKRNPGKRFRPVFNAVAETGRQKLAGRV